MNAERMKVLELLAEGKITAADADRLLEKLQHGAAETGQRGKFKLMRIEEEALAQARQLLDRLKYGLELGQ